MKNLKNKGFTLIELLVVIAIIGILSSIVLISLNTARDKGKNVAIKQDLNGLRAQTEVYYDSSPTGYDGACDDPKIIEFMNHTNQTSGGTSVCNDEATAWAVSSPLLNTDTTYWCVDSTGRAVGHNTDLGTDTVCPTS